MNAIQFDVKSSSGSPYVVDFLVIEDRVRVFCRCQAGKNRMICKHVIGLLSGDVEVLERAEDGAALAEALKIPEAVETLRDLSIFTGELAVLMQEKAALVAREKELKAELGRRVLRTKS